jgi:hypothetical protein
MIELEATYARTVLPAPAVQYLATVILNAFKEGRIAGRVTPTNSRAPNHWPRILSVQSSLEVWILEKPLASTLLPRREYFVLFDLKFYLRDPIDDFFPRLFYITTLSETAGIINLASLLELKLTRSF